MMWGNGYGSGWMWMFGIMVFLGLILVIGAVVWAISRGNHSGGQGQYGADRTSQPQPGSGPGSSKARQMLDERYARGEIDAQEYRDRRDALSEGT